MADESDASIQSHYFTDPEALSERILMSLRNAGKDIHALTVDDLAPIDQFHTGGKSATLDLLRIANPREDMRVIDVGGGLGGPARLLASTIHCHVTVLDLTEAFCRTGEMLTRRLGLSDRVAFVHGNALAMPFAPMSFDLAWLQNASMNIADKEGLYREMHRVLKPGGRLVLQDIMAGPIQPIHYPVPWANDATLSFLWPPERLRDLLRDLGFAEAVWTEVLPVPPNPRAGASAAPGSPGYSVFLGERSVEMARNSLRNRVERRTVMVQAALDRL